MKSRVLASLFALLLVVGYLPLGAHSATAQSDEIKTEALIAVTLPAGSLPPHPLSCVWSGSPSILARPVFRIRIPVPNLAESRAV